LKHVEDSNKHITEGIVRQVGYLPELFYHSSYQWVNKLWQILVRIIYYQICNKDLK